MERRGLGYWMVVDVNEGGISCLVCLVCVKCEEEQWHQISGGATSF